MSQATWTTAIGWVLVSEGPEVNVSKQEPGGISKYGVSLQTYAEWCKRTKRPVPTFDTIRNLSSDQAATFYRSAFGDVIHYDELPAGVDYRLLDIATNLGVSGGLRLLAAVLGQWDSMEGRVLAAAAAQKVDSATLIRDLGIGWIAIKSQASSWYPIIGADGGILVHGNGHGWTNRWRAADAQAMTLIT